MTREAIKEHIATNYSGLMAKILTAEVDYVKKGYFFGHIINGTKTNLVNDNGELRITFEDLTDSKKFKSMRRSKK